jgi:uncharacterized protein (TIGR02687 family)
VVLTGSNTFAVKKLLCQEDTTSNFLVYQPLRFQQEDDNWLVNVQLYSEEFHADRNSIWMDQMGLPSSQIIRQQMKKYNKFFGAKERRDAVAKLNQNITTGAQMHLAVMAALGKAEDTRPTSVIRAVLLGGLEQNSIYESFETYGAKEPFWALVAQGTGYQEEEPSLRRLAIHILLTAATRTMHPDSLRGLEDLISIPHQAFCYDLVSEWLHGEQQDGLYELAELVEEETGLPERFGKLQAEDLADTECFPCIDVCILSALMTEVHNQTSRAESIRKLVEKRRTLVWYPRLKCYYESILQIANMLEFYQTHAGGFHTVEPYRIWQAYTEDYYRMDTYYRQFHLWFQRCLKTSDPRLDDQIKQVADKVEGLYAHWFLGSLGQNWSDACAEDLAENGRILEVSQQTSFYSSKVRPCENRVFVIISDALRYEVAASLAEQLRLEGQGTVTLSSCEAIFPTVTKFGMAALLPHDKLEVREKTPGTLGVLADGVPTDAGYREKILKSANPNSVAVRYDSFMPMKRAERAALIKGMSVVYIYHDKIDAASHTADSEVFPSCEAAIEEIKSLVRTIVHESGSTNVIITADHGFLYTYSPLSEDAKVDKTTPNDQDVEIDRRYLITRKGAKPEYLLPVRFLEGKTDYDAFAPRENVRIKKKGGGLNFVHGGISLQELVVPVIEYQHLHSSTKAYQQNRDKIDTKPVTLTLLSADRKVHNMIFSLNFYQKEPVGGNRKAANYLLYFTDESGMQISDSCKIIADRTSENGQDRTFRVSFNLRSLKYDNRDSYYLVIADESGEQLPQREEFRIDIAFAVEEYDFFT